MIKKAIKRILKDPHVDEAMVVGILAAILLLLMSLVGGGLTELLNDNEQVLDYTIANSENLDKNADYSSKKVTKKGLIELVTGRAINEENISKDKSRREPIKIKPRGLPNPEFLIPSMLLMIILIALLMLRRIETTPVLIRIIAILHVTLITIVIALLLLTFKPDLFENIARFLEKPPVALTIWILGFIAAVVVHIFDKVYIKKCPVPVCETEKTSSQEKPEVKMRESRSQKDKRKIQTTKMKLYSSSKALEKKSQKTDNPKQERIKEGVIKEIVTKEENLEVLNQQKEKSSGSEPTKEQALQYLSNCPEAYAFWVHNGSVLMNLYELRDAVESMGTHLFSKHVNKEKNDFSVWIKDIIGDAKLAGQIARSKKKKTILRKLRQRIGLLEWISKKCEAQLKSEEGDRPDMN